VTAALTGGTVPPETRSSGAGRTCPSASARPPSRSWPPLDPRREQVDYLSDAGRTDVRSAGGSHQSAAATSPRRRSRRWPSRIGAWPACPRLSRSARGCSTRRARRHAGPATGATTSRKRGLSPLNLWAAHPPPPFGQVIPKREDLTRNDLGFVRPRSSSLGGFLPMFARRLLVSLDLVTRGRSARRGEPADRLAFRNDLPGRERDRRRMPVFVTSTPAEPWFRVTAKRLP
jgi:hypothetical protein